MKNGERLSRIFFVGAVMLSITWALVFSNDNMQKFDRGVGAETVSPLVLVQPSLVEAAPVEAPEPPALVFTKKVLRPFYLKTIYVDVSTYTPDSDSGKPDRPTSGRTLRETSRTYPRQYTTLKYIIEHRKPIIAVPWRDKYLHTDLIDHGNGVMFHQYRLRSPWYDAPGVYRVPCDRVPYRDGAGNLLKQRDRFDLFMHMPAKQAVRHGVPFMPLEIFEMRWTSE